MSPAHRLVVPRFRPDEQIDECRNTAGIFSEAPVEVSALPAPCLERRNKRMGWNRESIRKYQQRPDARRRHAGEQFLNVPGRRSHQVQSGPLDLLRVVQRWLLIRPDAQRFAQRRVMIGSPGGGNH